MGVVLLIMGLVVLAATAIDLVWTTLSLSGGGPLTALVSRSVGLALIGCHRLPSLRRLSHHAALGVIIATLLSWVLLTWAGWALVFAAGEHAVVEAQSGAPADGWSRIYFAGYSMITLGTGDYRPGGQPWQVASVLAAINGFILVTLAISYLVPIISAAVEARRLALSIAHLGEGPEALVTQGWSGENFDLLSQHLVTLAPSLVISGQRLLVFPVLCYDRTSDPSASLPRSLAILDEALTLLERGVAPEHRPAAIVLEPTRRAITELQERLAATVPAGPAREAPHPPSLGPLREAGIPTIADAAFRAALEGLDDRRRLLLGLVQWQGWRWPSAPSPRQGDRPSGDD